MTTAICYVPELRATIGLWAYEDGWRCCVIGGWDTRETVRAYRSPRSAVRGLFGPQECQARWARDLVKVAETRAAGLA
jgi:hypothetical protein